MALLQPTYIYPDMRNGLGAGTIDATAPLSVSWRVNGSSAMTNFSISIYTNDASSTQLYTTGKISDGCPFYGTTYTGEIQFFSYTISAADLSTAGITNGNEYKILIKQWWGANDFVEQTSASVFITREAPIVSIPTIGTISTRYYTFTGNYSQAQGDVLNWFRWQIAYANNTDSPFFDSGNISGTMDISAYYDGFFANTQYAVKLDIQTENGINATSGWVSFDISYTPQPIDRGIYVDCISNGVKVDFSGITYIPGTADGDYDISDGELTIYNGSKKVRWDTVNGSEMSFGSPWTFICKFKFNSKRTSDVATLINLRQDEDVYVVLSQSSIDGKLNFLAKSKSWHSDWLNTPIAIGSGDEVTLIVTKDKYYMRVKKETGGLYPSQNLYPSDTLYPQENTETQVILYENEIQTNLPSDYEQAALKRISVYGNVTYDFIEVINGDASDEIINAAYRDGTYSPSGDNDDYFLAEFNDSLNGGGLSIGEGNLVGYSLYRREDESGVLTHIADTLPTQTVIYDYGAKSQHKYTYYLFPLSDTSYVTDPIESEQISTCFWNWVLLECQKQSKDVWNVVSVYPFSTNLTSGAISNNNHPNVTQNFTPYALVQLACQNYKSGTLQSLIGKVTMGKYSDSVKLADDIYRLSITSNDLFLKNRKGELLKVRVSDAIAISTADDTIQQMQSVSIPWVEVGDAERASLISDNEVIN